MKNKYLCCILAAIMSASFSSCSKQDDGSGRLEPVIKTLGRIVAAEPEGGQYGIGYTLIDNISGASIKPDAGLLLSLIHI